MSRIGALLVVALAFALSVGCGYGSHNYMNGRGGPGAPNIAELIPGVTTHGGPGFALTINGTGFGTDSVVYWNGMTQGTTYVSANQLMSAITAADIANPGMVTVYVLSGRKNSNNMTFTVE